MGTVVLGTGSCLPERILTNKKWLAFLTNISISDEKIRLVF